MLSQPTQPSLAIPAAFGPRARFAALVSGASLLALSAGWVPGAAAATLATLPSGGHFTAGAGSIVSSGKNLSINQTTTRGIINWQSFSIGRGDKVSIDNGSGATLNRVTGNNPSKIAGMLTSTGSVYVVNTAGVIVMPTGKVFTSGSFVASTRDVSSNRDFMAGGTDSFTGTSSAAVNNQGTIKSANGDVVLIGSSVTNSGSISAAKGGVSLAAGNKVLLQDGANETVQVETGTGDVTNSGAINAAQVQLAAADGNVYALATNNGGIIRATGTATKDGRVYLTADGDTVVDGKVSAVDADGSGGRILAKAGLGKGTLTVGGTVSASATGAAKTGGKVTLVAGSIDLAKTAKVSADGTAAGGDIFIGGDRHGGAVAAEDLSRTRIATADTVTISRGSVISASGGSRGGSGDGGNVVVWSDKVTTYRGAIFARGGKTSGDGGFVEVSGEGLAFHGAVKTTAAHGKSGTLLLDPSDVTIFSSTDTTPGLPGGSSITPSGGTYDPTTGTSFILNSDIDTLLKTNDVVINTGSTSDGLPGAGNIHFGDNAGTNGLFSAPIYWNSNHSLTLNAIGVIDTIGGAPTSATGTDGSSGALAAATNGILIESEGHGSFTLNAGIGPGLTGTVMTISADIEAHGGTITLASQSGGNFIVDSANITNAKVAGSPTLLGSIVLQSDLVRLGTGHHYIGSVVTDGNVFVQPTTPGAVLVGNNYNGGGTAQQPDDDTANTALINPDSIKVISCDTLVIGSAAVTDLTIGSPTGINTTTNPTPYPGIAAAVNNLEFLTGANGSITQDQRTPIAVTTGATTGTEVSANGGLVLVTGGSIFLPDFLNFFNKIAIKQLSGRTVGGSTDIVVQGNSTNDNIGSLNITTLNGISGISAPGSNVTLINVGTTTQDAGAAGAITSGSLVLEGGATGQFAAYDYFDERAAFQFTYPDGNQPHVIGSGFNGFTGNFVLNNTSNAISKIAGSVGSLSLADSVSLTVSTLSDNLPGTGHNNFTGSATTFDGINALYSNPNLPANASLDQTGSVTITVNGILTIANGAPITTTLVAGASAGTAGGNVLLEAGSPNYGTGTPASGTGFINDDTTGISVTGGGYWRIYSQDPRNDSYGALAGTVGSPNYAFIQYSAANYYGDPAASGSGTSTSPSPFAHANSVLAGNYTGTGNGFLYTVAPTVSESITKVVTKVYDGTTAVVPGLIGTDYSSVGGTINNDNVILSHPGSADYNSKDVNATTISTTGISLVSAADSLGVQVFGYTVTTTASGTGTITPKALTFGGLTANGKVYDATLLAILSGAAALTGHETAGTGNSTDGLFYTGDGIGLTAATGGTFSQKDVGNGLSVTVNGVALTGNTLGDYTLTPLVGLTANITPKALTFAGLTANGKIYDATTDGTLSGTAALTGHETAGTGNSTDGLFYTGDGIGLTAATGGTFSQKDVGNGLAVTVNGVALTNNTAGDYTLTPLVGLTANITPKALTVTGLSALDKIYDATTGATVSGTAALTGHEAAGTGTSADGLFYTGDAITISGSATGTFSQKDVGTNLNIVVGGVTLGNNIHNDYTLASVTGLTANITPKALTFAGLTANDKIYDATTDGTLSGTATLTGHEGAGTGSSTDGKWYNGDGIGITAATGGTFSQKDVDNNLAVTVNGVALTGNGLGDYTLTPLIGLTADITPKALTFAGLTALDKIYDATTDGTLSGTATLTGHEGAGTGTSSDGKWYNGDGIGITATTGGTFSQKDVGTNLHVTVNGVGLTGNGLGDYTLTPLVGLTADITPKALTVTGLSALDKIYDATTGATVSGTAALTGHEAAGTGTSADGLFYTGDAITISGSATGTFSQKDVGNNLNIVVGGVTLGNNIHNDYTLASVTGLTANITPKALTFAGLTANDKIYDATTDGTLSGTATLTGHEAAGTGSSTDGLFYTGDGIGLTAATGGTFSQKDVHNNLHVTVNGVALTGNTLGDYTLTPLIGLTANITPKALTFAGLTALNKIYDATTGGTLSGTATLTGHETAGTGTSADGKWYTGDGIGLTAATGGTFSQKDVGNGLHVTVNGVALTGNTLGDYTLTPLVGLTAKITPKALTFAGLTANDKIYDATTDGTLSGTATLTGHEAAGTGGSGDGKWYNGDGIGLTAATGGTFSQKDVHNNLHVTVNGVALTGNGLGDYTLTPLVGLTANITPKALTFAGLTALNKIYDATTDGTLSGTATLTGHEAAGSGTSADGKWYTGDGIGLTAATGGTFSQKDVGNGLHVTVNGVALTGNGLGDYTLTPLIGLTAKITPKALTFAGLTANDKIYDATTDGTLSGTATLTGHEAAGTGSSTDGKWYTGDGIGLTAATGGTFSQKDVDNGLHVTVNGVALTGNGLGDYTLTPLVGLTADITPKALTFAGLTAKDKIYDATTGAILTGAAALKGSEAVGAGSNSDGKWYVGDGIGITAATGGTFSQKDVGNGLHVSVNGVALTGNTKNDYVLTPLIGLTANITPKALTVAGLEALSKVYDGTTAAVVDGTASLGHEAVGAGNDTDGKFYNGDGLGLTGTATGAFSQKNVGNHLHVSAGGLTLTGNELGDYTLSPLITLTANITPKVLTVTGDKVYDGTTGFVTGELDITGTVAGETVSLTHGTGTSSSANVGAYNGSTLNGITFSVTGGLASNYAAPATGKLIITPKALTITADNQTKVYGTTFTFGGTEFSTTGLVTGDNVTTVVLGSTGAVSTANVAGSPYVINASAANGTGLGNYTITYKKGRLTVTKARLVITPDDQTKTYGDVFTFNGTEFTTTGLVTANGDTVTSATLTSLGAPATADVGHSPYAIKATHAIGTGLGNYVVVYHTGELTVTPRAIGTAIVVAGTRVYDGTTDAPATDLSITNIVNGDKVGLLGTGVSMGSDVGTWDLTSTGGALTGLTLTGKDRNNYTTAGGTGTLTITPLPVIMTGTRVYDGLTDGNATILHITNALGGDNVEIVQDDGTSTISSKHVGDRTIIDFGTLKLGNNDKGDYTLVGAKGDVIVTPLPIVGISTRPYDGGTDVDGGIITVTNTPPGDHVTVTGDGTSDGPHTGGHPVDPTGLTIVGGPGTDPRDYTTTGGNITVNITPLPVILLGTRVYDGFTDGNGDILAVTNAIPGDTVDVASGTSTIASRNVGREGIVDFGTLTLGNNPNGDYTLVGATGTVIVTPLALTITAVPDTKTYDGTTTSDKTPIITVGTLVGGDTGSFTQSFGSPNAGNNITLTPTGPVNDGNGGHNYIITYDPISIGGVINPRPIDVTGTRPFDGTPNAPGSILTVDDGLIPGDSVIVAGGTGTLNSPNVGLEPVVGFGTLTLGGPDAGNYYIGNGTVNITPSFTPPPENQTASVAFSAVDTGIISLKPKQNGVVTGTIATNDGQDESPDTVLGCTLGDTGCLQNGIAPEPSKTPAK